MKKYNTVIFDMDGTLMNTLEDLTDSINYVMEKYHLPEKTMDEIKGFVGNGIPKLVERCVTGGREYPQFESILKEFQAHYLLNCNNKTGPYDGIKEMLSDLKQQGFKMAIVSNKEQQALSELVKLYFGDVITAAFGERKGIAKKPAKDMVMLALEELKSKQEESVYIGDSEVDIATAANSGLDCICVSWGFRERELLAGDCVKHVVDNPEEIVEILQK